MHGTLHVMVHEARNLKNADRESFGGKTDAYVRVIVDGKKGVVLQKFLIQRQCSEEEATYNIDETEGKNIFTHL